METEIGFYIEKGKRYITLGEKIAVEPKRKILKIGKISSIECNDKLAKELETILKEESKEICEGDVKKLLESGDRIYEDLLNNRFYDENFETTPKILTSISSTLLIGFGSYLNYVAFFSKMDDATKILLGFFGGAALGIGAAGAYIFFSDLIRDFKAKPTKKRIEDLLKKEGIKYRKVLAYDPKYIELIVKY